MVSYNNILLEKKGELAVIILNNPENRNPPTGETKDEILSALDEVESDDKIRALIITGRGSACCAGGDVNKSTGMNPEDSRQIMRKSQCLLKKILDLEKPLVVAVNGDSFDMGYNLVLGADFTITSEKARFSEVFVQLGIIPDFGTLYFLPRLISLSKSKELTYFGSANTS